MDSEQDKVLAKVRKLLQRSEDDKGSTDGEREQAMRMAHALLAKHNLSMAQAVERGEDAQGEKRVNDAFEMRSLAWARTISNGVAIMFYCRFFFVRVQGGREKHFFVGRTSNVITALEIAQFVIRSVLSERDRKAKVEGAHDPNPWKLAFAQGAATTIYARCVELHRKSEAVDQPDQPGTALVLASHFKREMKANEDFVRDQLGIKLKSSASSRSNRATDDARESGKEFGKRVSLSRQVGGGASSSKQLK